MHLDNFGPYNRWAVTLPHNLFRGRIERFTLNHNLHKFIWQKKGIERD